MDAYEIPLGKNTKEKRLPRNLGEVLDEFENDHEYLGHAFLKEVLKDILGSRN